MPKVNWCKTKVLRRQEAAAKLMTRIDAECAACGMTGKDLAAAIGMTYTTFRRRRANPCLLTVSELQSIADNLHLVNSEDFKSALYNLIT